MLLVPTRIVEPPSPAAPRAKPAIRRGMFDVDSGIFYVELGADLISIITNSGVHVQVNESLDDFCNKLLEAAKHAAAEEADAELMMEMENR